MIMYSSNKYIHHQYYVSTEWTGGIFVSPTLAGSRSGGIIAATWASLMHHGWNGYTQMTRDVIKAANVVRFIYIRVMKSRDGSGCEGNGGVSLSNA